MLERSTLVTLVTFVTLVLATPSAPALAQRAGVPVDGGAEGEGCTVQGDASAIEERCTSSEGRARSTRLTCTVLLVADLAPAEGLETVVSCSESEGSDGLVAVILGGRVAWASRRWALEGVSASALRLRFQTGHQQLLLYRGTEDSTELEVLSWTGRALATVLRTTVAWGMADPEAAVEVRYVPGTVPVIETVTRRPGQRATRQRWRWLRGGSEFTVQ